MEDRGEYPEQLALFETPSRDLMVQRTQYVEYRPTSQLNSGPLEFRIPSAASQYFDLHRTRICLKVQIRKRNGDPITGEDKVAPMNNMLYTMFSQAEVRLQQQLVSSSGSLMYGYQAYFQALMEQNREASETYLQMACFYKDRAGFMDSMDPDPRGNTGLVTRFLIFQAGGGIADLEGPLSIDIFRQKRALLNGIEMQIRLTPARPEFALGCGTDQPDYQITILDASLKLCKLSVIPAVILAHSAILSTSQATYPFIRNEIKSYHLATGAFGFNFEDLFQSDVPCKVTVGLVDAEAYRGSFKMNPFNFQNFGLRTIALFLDDESIPGAPIKLRFDQQMYQEGYSTLFDSDGNGPDISREDYQAGYMLTSFKLAEDCLPFTGRGNLRLTGNFGTSLAQNVVLIVFAQFPAVLKIDSARNVII